MDRGDRRWRADGAIQRLPIRDQAQIEARGQLAPQAGLAFGGRHGDLEQPAAALLDLVDQEGQHHQAHEHGAQVRGAVTEVVLEVIALVLEGVEGLVFDLAAGAGTSHQGHEVVLVGRDVPHLGGVYWFSWNRTFVLSFLVGRRPTRVGR